ncbi:hypothetical protein [Paenibacillus glacialis]|nr:hypothetical protein [Paenibacillus glacialis]
MNFASFTLTSNTAGSFSIPIATVVGETTLATIQLTLDNVNDAA